MIKVQKRNKSYCFPRPPLSSGSNYKTLLGSYWRGLLAKQMKHTLVWSGTLINDFGYCHETIRCFVDICHSEASFLLTNKYPFSTFIFMGPYFHWGLKLAQKTKNSISPIKKYSVVKEIGSSYNEAIVQAQQILHIHQLSLQQTDHSHRSER